MKHILHSLYLVLLCAHLSAQVPFTSSNLPIVIIDTKGQEIVDEPKIDAAMSVIYNGPGVINQITDPPDHYAGNIGIELRGSTSQFYAKKPYRVETRDADGENLNVALLDMPEENDWALIAPLNDKTLMRDVLAHAYAREVLPWSPRTRYCEVVLNGEYQGVYVLIEIIKRDDERVDMNNLKPDEISGNDLTGGYLLRMDKTGPPPGEIGGDWVSDYPPLPGSWQQTWFQYFEPKKEELHLAQATYIRQYIRNFENMLQAPDFADRYADWIDVDSWIDYLLVQELGKNTDGYRLSAYFYKQRDSDGGKIFMGPVWDFNIAFGIGDYCEGSDWEGWAKDFNSVCPGDGWVIHFWWERLWNEPAFRSRIAERWQAHRQGPWSDEQLFGVIDSMSNVLQEAQVRNFQRWPVLGEYVWPNAFIGNTYGQELDYLRNWLSKRLEWLDGAIPLLVSPTKQLEKELKVALYPNPGPGNFLLELPALAGGADWTLDLYDITGQHLGRKAISYYGSPQEIRLIELHSELAKGVYVCKLTHSTGLQTSKEIIVQQ